jgi:beta-lactamase class A
MKVSKIEARYVMVGAALFAAGLVGGLLIEHVWLGPSTKGITINREGGYEFVNPLLSCDVGEDTQYAGYAAFQKQLQSEADKLIARGDVTRISIYVRNMDNGYWTGVRAEDVFIPASLMKVPLMIAYLKESQTNSATMLKQLTLPQTNQNTKETIHPVTALVQPGRTYTVHDLITAMIEQSDNNASDALIDCSIQKNVC